MSKARPKTDLIAACLEQTEYQLVLGDRAREALSKPQLVAIAATLVRQADWPVPEDASLEAFLDELTQRGLRAAIGWLVGFEYFDESPDGAGGKADFVRHGSQWFRRAEIEQIHAALANT